MPEFSRKTGLGSQPRSSRRLSWGYTDIVRIEFLDKSTEQVKINRTTNQPSRGILRKCGPSEHLVQIWESAEFGSKNKSELLVNTNFPGNKLTIGSDEVDESMSSRPRCTPNRTSTPSKLTPGSMLLLKQDKDQIYDYKYMPICPQNSYIKPTSRNSSDVDTAATYREFLLRLADCDTPTQPSSQKAAIAAKIRICSSKISKNTIASRCCGRDFRSNQAADHEARTFSFASAGGNSAARSRAKCFSFLRFFRLL